MIFGNFCWWNRPNKCSKSYIVIQTTYLLNYKTYQKNNNIIIIFQMKSFMINLYPKQRKNILEV